jgi:hypothetical protein
VRLAAHASRSAFWLAQLKPKSLGLSAIAPITTSFLMRHFIAACLAALCVDTASAQAPNRLEGVWLIVERVTPAANPRAMGVEVVSINPQPGLIIFTRGHYSEVYLGGPPRAVTPSPVEPLNLSDAEKIAKYEEWRPLTANAGTYEVSGSVLTRHPLVAKNVEVLTRPTRIPLELRFEDENTLWLMPMGERATVEPRTKLVRVE